MISTALRPKWLALLALVTGIVLLFGWLGLWQLNVAQRKGQVEALEKVAQAPEAPVDEVLAPQTSLTSEMVGRAVRATGHYDPAHQVLVVQRRLGDRSGSWVLTPLVVDGTGARLAVVRGFVDSGAAVPPAPTGTVTVHGTLEPQEGPPEKPTTMPPGQVQTVDLASAVNVWSGDIYNGFVLASREEPPAPGPSAQLTPVPSPKIDLGGVNWRNAAYAIQWWVFAAFVVYVWWRMVRDDHQLRVAARRAAPANVDATHGPPTAGQAHHDDLPSTPSPGGSSR